jgi:spermidine synthase
MIIILDSIIIMINIIIYHYYSMFDDAARYLKNEGKSQGYDVIICDSSDPVGPAEVLFQPEFFTSMRDALAPGVCA